MSSADKMIADSRALERADRAKLVTRPVVTWERLDEDVQLPSRGTSISAGYDLRAFLTGSKAKLTTCGTVIERGPDPDYDIPSLALLPGQRAIIPTGLKVALPWNYVMDVRPRSGTSFKKGLRIANSPGTIDPDYADEVGIIVENGTDTVMLIEHQERIAQVLFFEVEHPQFREGKVEPVADRTGGFGSTGTS